jgi:plastocyanin
MHRGFIPITLLLFTAACQPGSTVKNEKDSTADEHAKQAIENLYDTTHAPLRNTDHFHSVEIRQMQFVPEILKVHKGDTIAWINNDIVVHDITEEKKKEWSSTPLAIGSTWKKVADKSSDYFCSIHVVMKGKIIVE